MLRQESVPKHPPGENQSLGLLAPQVQRPQGRQAPEVRQTGAGDLGPSEVEGLQPRQGPEGGQVLTDRTVELINSLWPEG